MDQFGDVIQLAGLCAADARVVRTADPEKLVDTIEQVEGLCLIEAGRKLFSGKKAEVARARVTRTMKEHL
eukprot:1830629-Lingulodinium_polyedra.AAC.1